MMELDAADLQETSKHSLFVLPEKHHHRKRDYSVRLRSHSMDRNLPPSSTSRPLHPFLAHHHSDAFMMEDEPSFEAAANSNQDQDDDKMIERPVLQSAASWDELDFTSKKRSTRKHAHFASMNDSACKKQRGTPIRKSIFTPIKQLQQQQAFEPSEPMTILQKPKPNKRSFGTCTTACSTLALDESTDHSVDSGTSNFRFTAFPASLPRIHQSYHLHHHSNNNNISGLHASYNHDDAELYYYSGDDEDHQTADDSTVASSVLGTPVARLNFAAAMMPTTTAPCCTCTHDTFPQITDTTLSTVELPESTHHPHDAPSSFASSVSSIAKNNISACDHEESLTQSTAALTPSRAGGSGSTLLDPDTPREVQVHFHQMPNCSPIPGIPEGNESSMSSCRPLPDSHAFDENNLDDDEDDDETNMTSQNSSSDSHVPALPHLCPPPTPIRIPTWSHLPSRPNQRKLLRSNSLLATKVLASDAATSDLFPEVMTLSGSFRIVGSPLGRGVFADVCKVQSKTDERFYAVKCQRKAFRGRKDRDIALAEVRCMLELQKDPPLSPYLLRFFKAWQEDERIHVLTELCCKDTCRQLLDKQPDLPLNVVWKILYDVSSGLAHMHARKLIHNDIKPSNILLIADDAAGAICKIGDFGMTRVAGSMDDGQEGDQKYMAMELLQASTKLASSADMFSLGLTIYEAASNSLIVPSHGSLWRQLRNGEHKVRIRYDDEDDLVRLIRSMMDPEPTKRMNAMSIVNESKVENAGTSYCRFLADYIQRVDGPSDNDEGEEETAEHDLQTPRHMRSLCSPPPNIGAAFLFSSPQA